MELSPSLEKFAKDVFRKSKARKRSIDQDFKECAELVQYDQSIGTSFLGGLFEIANCENKKNQAMHRFNAYFPARLLQDAQRNDSILVRRRICQCSISYGAKDLSSCYEILGVSPEGEFFRD